MEYNMEYNMELEMLKIQVEKAERLKEQRKRACIKYKQNKENREVLNAIARKYYDKKLKDNREYLDQKKEYYNKKKMQKLFPEELILQ
jgi:hypothetical protein